MQSALEQGEPCLVFSLIDTMMRWVSEYHDLMMIMVIKSPIPFYNIPLEKNFPFFVSINKPITQTAINAIAKPWWS